jgi:very-short-patch-repair endonuclease
MKESPKIFNAPEKEASRKSLRNDGTPAEAYLWLLLKNRQLKGYRFRRQVSIGTYIVDFYCPSVHLAIELDGDSHFTAEGIEHDDRRTEYLFKNHGIRLLRFENCDVFNDPESVLGAIEEALDDETITYFDYGKY